MMNNLVCNLSNKERVNYMVIGLILLFGAILDFGRGFLFLSGLLLMGESIIGWCGISILSEKYKLQDLFKKNTP